MLTCNQPGECFAKVVSIKNPGSYVCECLTTGYKIGECPFQKKYRFVTNDVYYPYNTKYPEQNLDATPYEFIEEEDYEEVINNDYFTNARIARKRKSQKDQYGRV